MIGYKYYCTPACIGRNGVSGSNQLVRVKSTMISGTTNVMTGIRAQAVAGGNLPGLIAEVAARYGAIRHQKVDPGACKCHGGEGNCIGCDPKPVHKDFQRVAAPDGEAGLDGTPVVTTLRKGADGHSGSVTVVVRNDNGEENLYRSVYNLELVDFDIEDENGDGIFEPGEHLFIKRIKVRNTGGMPSPTRPIPVTVVESDWFKPVLGHEGTTSLPVSIPAGHSMTVEGSIKVLIRPNEVNPLPGVQFFRQEDIVINAEMPWLKRPLPHFEYAKTVDLQYPCELRNFNNLATLAQGTTGKITCEVYNKGHIPIGSAARIPRTVEVEILIPADYGALRTPEDQWLGKVAQDIAAVPATSPYGVQQTLRINDDAQTYQHVVIQLDLYIANPIQTFPEDDDEGAGEILTLIHRVEIATQISNEYNYNPKSDFLLVTNSVTSRQRSRLIEKFIREDLKMELDTWNVGLYGGLQPRPGEGRLVSETVLESYHGKTVLFLGNKFDFFTHGSHNVAELCDPHWLAEAISNGTNCLFLESSDFKSYEELLTAVAFANHHQMSTLDETVPESQKFSDVDELVRSIAQQKQFGHLGYTHFTIPVKKRWHHFGKANPESEAKRISKLLQKQLPQERCLVSFKAAERESSMAQIDMTTERLPELGISEKRGFESDCGSIVISIGAAPHISLAAIEPANSTFTHAQQSLYSEASQEGTVNHQLDAFERYMIVASLPISRRVDLLWFSARSPADLPTSPANVCSSAALEETTLSLICAINTEITTVLRHASWTDSLIPSNPQPDVVKGLLATHFPALHMLLYHPLASDAAVPVTGAILTLLRYALASTRPQKKRQAVHSALAPSDRRANTQALLTAAVSALLAGKGYAADELADFFAGARALHSLTDATKRDTAKLITRRVAEATRRSEYAFAKGRREARDVVEGTTCVNPEVWDRRVQWADQRAGRVRAWSEGARGVLGRMLESGARTEM